MSPTCHRTSNSHLSLTERRTGIRDSVGHVLTRSWWLNSLQLLHRQVMAHVCQDAVNLPSQILFVKLFHMLNCRRGIEIPGNVDMSRRCGTQMQRHTKAL